ncbi:MAG: hypothetical protein QM728_06285 [Gordonia sp. (in: high G+C Gram-positive bacteria)]|uniref:hypothetical protein n=1 Tax=Gordonia sp. (in: high G+C Gram-positive bacteria) TaxID=84139 RepID=UPI0039E505D7
MEPHDQNDPTIPAPPSVVPSVPGGAPEPGQGPSVTPAVTGTPQLWLTPGPYLPRRDWQQRTRTLITSLTGVGGALWLLGVIAIVITGFIVSSALKTSTVKGHGGVIVPCNTKLTPDASAEEGTPVTAWSDKTDKVLTTRLEAAKTVQVPDADHPGKTVARCHLPFKFDKLRRDAVGYNVRIGDSAPQFVTTASLVKGAYVPVVPVTGGER